MLEQLKATLFLFSGTVLALVSAVTGAAQDSTAVEHFRDGLRKIQHQNYQGAADALRQAVEANDNFGEAWFWLGYSLHSQDKLQEAIEADRRASEFLEYKGVANYNLGCAYSLLGQTDQAIEALQLAVGNGFDDAKQFLSDPDLCPLYTDFRFARMLARLQHNGPLIQQMTAAEKIISESRYSQAAETYNSIFENDRTNAFAIFRAGEAMQLAGNLDRALEFYSKATELPEFEAIATFKIACIYSLQNKTDKALAVLNKAVSMGLPRWKDYENDADLANVRSDSRFQLILARDKTPASKRP